MIRQPAWPFSRTNVNIEPVYAASPRLYPRRRAVLAYPGHYEVRRVSYNGGIRWHSTWVNVRQTLGGEVIDLVEIDDGEWDVDFGPLRRGRSPINFEQQVQVA